MSKKKTMGRGAGVVGICIKSYKNEDDSQDYEDGKINESEIKVYEVGELGIIIIDFYDKEYWEINNDKIINH